MGIDAATYSWIKPHLDGRTLMLGRQHWCDGSKDQRRYFDEVFDFHVESLDVNGTEKPDHCLDLNQSLPFNAEFDMVFDGGTIEHVFNVPVALESIRRALKPGGVFASVQLLNLAGHGFWSLSPELLWRWSQANGFIHQQCDIKRVGPLARTRMVQVKEKRLELTSCLPLVMYFKAIKFHDKAGVPEQAGPCLDKPLKFWAWTARLYSQTQTL